MHDLRHIGGVSFGVSYGCSPLCIARMDAMRQTPPKSPGRPKKDPTGDDLRQLNVKQTKRVIEAAKQAAAARRMSLTDYVAWLIAQDNQAILPDLAASQEVLPLTG